MSETSEPYRPSDPYEWGLQGTRPAAVEHHDSEPFQAPRVPKEDDPEDFDQPPPPAPEPRVWVMEGYLPMLWRALFDGFRKGDADAQRIIESLLSKRS